ncbi:hypothetical protein ACFRFO_28480, partial [Streptomyces sp. NPDC056664]|uniref:hypothetical protein n=1 Tax=Streptomyces sp. NPDC056664 TaxID=3345900 RepID=UPI00367870C2
VIPAGSFAKDWTQITALSGDRILYYSASKGRGVIGTVDSNNVLKDVTVIPAGSFAKDWTQITALSGDRILYYSASKGRGLIGTINSNNVLQDVTVIPDGSFAKDWEEIIFLRPPGRPSYPWAFLLVQFSDATTPTPFTRERFEEMCTTAGAGKFNLVDFYRDMSHGNLDLSTSRVLGWHRLSQKESDYVGSGGNPQGRRDLITWARQAVLNAGENLAPYANRIFVVTHPPTDLFGIPEGAVSGDGRDSQGMTSLAPSLVGHEMGHVHGLDHSWGGGYEYGDHWDVMSNRTPYMAPHPVYAELDSAGRPIWRIGPGLNAASMWGKGWLDMTRVWQAGATESDVLVDLRPLHRHDLPGHLCARVGPYFFEFRVKERWDAAIPEPCVLVHELTYSRSFLLTATESGGRQDLREGDEFLRGDPDDPTGSAPLIRVKVLDIDAAARTVRLSVTQRPDLRFMAGPETRLFGAEGVDGGLIVIGGKVVDVPPGSPLSATIEEIAQQLQETGVAPSADGDGYLHRDLLRAIASLTDLVSRMESPCVPHDLVRTDEVPASSSAAAHAGSD